MYYQSVFVKRNGLNNSFDHFLLHGAMLSLHGHAFFILDDLLNLWLAYCDLPFQFWKIFFGFSPFYCPEKGHKIYVPIISAQNILSNII